jgi:hypothetical protein
LETLEENESEERIIQKFNLEYPLAGQIVNGLTVRSEIPNLSSISASLNEYFVLKGIRSFPIHGFTGKASYYNIKEQNRVTELAKTIKKSREINPLIIVEEKNGPYVLEGGHRISACVELKRKLVPALIVIDLESFS